MTSDSDYSSRLPPRALAYVNLRTSVDVIAITVILETLVLIFATEPWRTWIAGGLVVAVVVGLAIDLPIINRMSVLATSYQVDPDGVRIRRGLLVKSDVVVATAQLLSVAVIEGPLLARFGLAKVTFATIAHVEPIGPVTLDEAIAIRSRALSHFGIDDGVHDDGAVANG